MAEVESAPRRGTLRAPLLRSLLAPLALSGVLVVAWSSGVVVQPPVEASGTTQVTHTVGATDLRRAAGLGPSRDHVREPLEEAAATQAPTPTAATPATAARAPEPTREATPEPTPTPTPEPTTVPEPAVDHSKLGDDAVAMWTKSSVNVRSGPGTGFDAINSFSSGSKVTATTLTEGNWQQINLRGKAGWVHKRYLSQSAPPTSAANTSASSPSGPTSSSSSSSSNGSGSSGSGSSTAQCSRAAGVEAGLTANTKNVLRAVCNRFTDINSFGGLRSGGGSYHNSGRAIDVMVSGERGWEVARWARENASQLGIIEVIYAQKIWTTQRSGDGWRSMSDRGSVSANHYDHVHISVR